MTLYCIFTQRTDDLHWRNITLYYCIIFDQINAVLSRRDSRARWTRVITHTHMPPDTLWTEAAFVQQQSILGGFVLEMVMWRTRAKSVWQETFVPRLAGEWSGSRMSLVTGSVLSRCVPDDEELESQQKPKPKTETLLL